MSLELLAVTASFRRIVLLILTFGLPVFFLWDITYDAFNVPKIALLATCVGIAGGVRLLEIGFGRSATGLRALSIPALFIALPLTASWLFNTNKQWTLLGEHTRFEGLLPYLLMIAAGMLIADAFVKRPLVLAWTFVSAGSAVGAYALVQAVGADPLHLPLDSYVGSSIGHGNFVGGFLAVALPVALTIWIGNLRGSRVAAVSTILIIVGLILTLSQGAWAAGVAGSALAVGALSQAKMKSAPGIGAALALLVALAVVGNVLLAAFSPHHALVGGTTRARAEWWKAAARMGAEAPVFGHGPNAYALKSPAYRTPIDALGHGHRLSSVPHSVPLSFFANSGLVGLLGFFGMLVWAIRQRLRSDDPLLLGFFAGVVAYGTQAIVSVDQPVLVFALWVCLAGMTTVVGQDPVESGTARRPRWAVAVGSATALLIAVGGTTFGYALIMADRDALSGTRAMNSGAIEQGRTYFDAALKVQDVPAYRVTLGIQLGSAALKREEQGRALIDEMHDVLRPLYDLDYLPAITSEARALQLWSIYDETAGRTALTLLERAAAIDRFNPEIQTWLGETLLGLGRPEETVARLNTYIASVEQHLRSRSFTAPLWAVLAVAEDQLGQRVEALNNLERALHDARSTGTESSSCNVVMARIIVGGEDQLGQLPEALLCPQATMQAFGLT